MTQTQTQLSEAQAMVVVENGVRREIRKDSERTLDYCKDSVKLQGWNVRKLAQKIEAKVEIQREEAAEKGEEVPAPFNADSYQSNVSNANGIMALFDFDLELFETWLMTDANSRSLSKIFKQFRELFTEPKPKAEKPKNDVPAEAGEGSDEMSSDIPLVEQVLEALKHLSLADLERVVDAGVEIIAENNAVPAAA